MHHKRCGVKLNRTPFKAKVPCRADLLAVMGYGTTDASQLHNRPARRYSDQGATYPKSRSRVSVNSCETRVTAARQRMAVPLQ